MSYELLENDLTDSTLWLSCSKDAKLLFITILSKAYGSDVVRTPLPVLYQRAGLTEQEGAAALAELTEPDPDSKFNGEQGRRVVPIEDEEGRGLWLPSYASRRKRYLDRNRKAAQRDRERSGDVTFGHDASRPVTQGHVASRSVTHRHKKSPLEAEAEAEQKQKEGRGAKPFHPPTLDEVREYARTDLPGLDPEGFRDFYESKGWKVGNQPMKDWKAAARNWRRKDIEAGKVSPSKDEARSRTKDEADREAEAQRLAEIEIREVERARREGGF